MLRRCHGKYTRQTAMDKIWSQNQLERLYNSNIFCGSMPQLWGLFPSGHVNSPPILHLAPGIGGKAYQRSLLLKITWGIALFLTVAFLAKVYVHRGCGMAHPQMHCCPETKSKDASKQRNVPVNAYTNMYVLELVDSLCKDNRCAIHVIRKCHKYTKPSPQG